MAIKSYTRNKKQFFEVYVNGFDLGGRLIQWRKRGIESKRAAEETEFEFHRRLATLREEGTSFTWSEWLDHAMKRMRLELKNSTLHGYEMFLGTWVTPHWKDCLIRSITREDVFGCSREDRGKAYSSFQEDTLEAYQADLSDRDGRRTPRQKPQVSE